MRKMIVVLGLTLALVSLFGMIGAAMAAPAIDAESRPYCHADDAGGLHYLNNPAWVAHLENNGTPLSGHELDFFTTDGDDGTGSDQVECDGKTDPPPPPPVQDTDYTAQADCDGWEVWAQDTLDGQPDGNPYLVDSGTWTDPYALEQATSNDLTIDEPEECLQDKDQASVSIEVGGCTYREGQSYTLVSFTIFGEGVFTVNGIGYDETGEVTLTPGSYPWAFEAAEGFTGDDEGTLEIGSCAPGEPTPTPRPPGHPKTGPEDSAAVFGWLATIGIGLASAGIAGMKRR